MQTAKQESHTYCLCFCFLSLSNCLRPTKRKSSLYVEPSYNAGTKRAELPTIPARLRTSLPREIVPSFLLAPLFFTRGGASTVLQRTLVPPTVFFSSRGRDSTVPLPTLIPRNLSSTTAAHKLRDAYCVNSVVYQIDQAPAQVRENHESSSYSLQALQRRNETISNC